MEYIGMNQKIITGSHIYIVFTTGWHFMPNILRAVARGKMKA
jgi:hypothetical protein